jgi:hypothetical protein
LNYKFVLILKFREKFKWQGPLASGPRRPMATCPGQHAHGLAAKPRWLAPGAAGHRVPPAPPGHMRFLAFLSPRSVASSRRKSLLLPLRPISARSSVHALLLGAERRRRLEPLYRTSSRQDSPSCATNLHQVGPVIEPPSSVRRRHCTELPLHPPRASPSSVATDHETDALPAP